MSGTVAEIEVGAAWFAVGIRKKWPAAFLATEPQRVGVFIDIRAKQPLQQRVEIATTLDDSFGATHAPPGVNFAIREFGDIRRICQRPMVVAGGRHGNHLPAPQSRTAAEAADPCKRKRIVTLV